MRHLPGLTFENISTGKQTSNTEPLRNTYDERKLRALCPVRQVDIIDVTFYNNLYETRRSHSSN